MIDLFWFKSLLYCYHANYKIPTIVEVHAVAVYPDWNSIMGGLDLDKQPHVVRIFLSSWPPISEHCESVGVIGDVQGIGEGEEEK